MSDLEGGKDGRGPFSALPRNHYRAILADPPWGFVNLWNTPIGPNRGDCAHYSTMTIEEIVKLPVAKMAADDCVLFMWGIWILLPKTLDVIDAWGFQYKTCAFDWMKANAGQIDMFRDDSDVQMGLGYWTRANTEHCLLATRGKPKRLNADVRQGIIEPRREHSRKPDCVHSRIERLVAGPYLELFARQQRPGWDCWGNEVTKFNKPEAAA
jgi:N6-adenosine-specific RNA methylase IME4